MIPLLLLTLAAPPDAYHVRLRYSIDAERTERALQFAEMAVALRAAGFVREDEPPEDEALDRSKTRMEGTVPAAGVPKLLAQRHVRSLLLWPKGTKRPEGDARVRVEIALASGFLPETQRALHRQTAEALANAGFVEAFGYDARRGTRLVGSMPGGKLDLALEDPRAIPGAGAIDAPFRNLQAIRATVARPDLPAPAARPKPAAVPPEQEKYSPDLRTLLGAEGTAKRLEVMLDYTPDDADTEWLKDVRVGGAAVEGRVGPLVSVAGDAKTIAPELAKQPRVLAIRLPRPARPAPLVKGEVPPGWSPLRRSGVAQLHSMARRGKGTRVAVLADDFTGWEALPGAKEKRVTLLDLTALRSPKLDPDPPGRGDGTRYARSVIDAAPEAEVVLVRVPPDAPYLVQSVARAINREPARLYLLEQRFREILADRELANFRRDEVARLREAYLDDPRENEAGLARRKAFDDANAAFLALDQDVRRRTARWFALDAGLRTLAGVRVAASSLVWTDGFPVDGSSALSRYFDDRPFKAALWFQAAGDTRGQSWSGPFRDADGNGFMELHGKAQPEVAWLSWLGRDGKKADAGGTLRAVLQWKEAHDPLPLRVGEDPYRAPLAKLRLLVVRELATDDLEVVGQTTGTPIRLDQTATAATYEALIDVKLPGPGRYGVMVEGTVPESTSAPGEVSVPASRRRMELRPRLFIDALDGAARPVFADLPSDTAAFGMPADARRVLTVGAADASGEARADSAAGAPYGAALASRPDLLAYGPSGSGEAAAFAAGMAAVTANAKGSFAAFVEAVRDRPGALARVPVGR